MNIIIILTLFIIRILTTNKVQRLVSFGNNEDGELGNIQDKYSEIGIGVNYTTALRNSTIISICSGSKFTIVLVEIDGTENLISFGNNENGELGRGSDIEYSNKPDFVNNTLFINDKILDISCGSKHVLVLTKNRIFSWGSNSYGQLGVDINKFSSSPVEVTFFNGSKYNAKKIFTGDFHSFAITENNIFCWGRTKDGQCGEPPTFPLYEPFIIDFNHSIKEIHGGETHTIFLTEINELYSVGLNKYGQLGDGTFTNSMKFKKIYSDSEIIENLCVRDNHNALILKNGSALTWGYNKNGELGIGTKDNSNILRQSLFQSGKNIKLKKVTCGIGHTLFLADNKIYGTGLNDYGQIGDLSLITKIKLNEIFYSKIFLDSNFLDIYAGGKFSLILTYGKPFCNQIQAGSEGVCSRNGTCIGEDICVCEKDHDGLFCQFNICYKKWLPCEDTHCVCSGHGICASKDNCECFDGYTGSQCQYISCFGISGSSTEVCGHHGICVAPNQCECLSNTFGGKDCSKPICYHHLSDEKEVCSGHGTCFAPDNCQCDSFWVRDDCDFNQFLLIAIFTITIFILLLIAILLSLRKILERKKFSKIFFFKSKNIKKVKKILSDSLSIDTKKKEKTEKNDFDFLEENREKEPLITSSRTIEIKKLF